jgi:hypothetical protein
MAPFDPTRISVIRTFWGRASFFFGFKKMFAFNGLDSVGVPISLGGGALVLNLRRVCFVQRVISKPSMVFNELFKKLCGECCSRKAKAPLRLGKRDPQILQHVCRVEAGLQIA